MSDSNQPEKTDTDIKEYKSYEHTFKTVNSVEHYANTRYKHLDQKILHWREKALVDKILKKVKPTSKTILDAPTGYGRFTPNFIKFDLEITNADLNLNTLKYQQKVFPSAEKSSVGNIFNLPFKDNQFDIVFNFRLLQHFAESSERENALKELSRVTKRWAVVSSYITSYLHMISHKISGRPGRLAAADLDIWEKEVDNAGFKIVDSHSVLKIFHAHRIFLLEKK